jgi:ribulose-phosphate 3-epimerase
MTVNPGFGGQSFINESYGKIRELSGMISSGGFDVLIQVDGGVDTYNARALVEAGVNVLVAGNAVFGSPDPDATIRKTKVFV